MKRQTQKPGVRKWYGEDLVALQTETLKALEEGLLGQQDNCILSGCILTKNNNHTYNLSKGFVYLGGSICPFQGAKNISLPEYLIKEVSEGQIREYADGQDKPTVIQHTTYLYGPEDEPHWKEDDDPELTALLKEKKAMPISQEMPRLILPQIDQQGQILNLTLSQVPENNPKKLLSAKALYDFQKMLLSRDDADSVIDTLQEVFDFIDGYNETNDLLRILNNKADKNHTHDDKYLLLEGGTTKGNLHINSTASIIKETDKTISGKKMHDGGQTKALYIQNGNASDVGGLAIDNDGVTAFGAGDKNPVFRVIEEDTRKTLFSVNDNGYAYNLEKRISVEGHQHAISDITDLEKKLNDKAPNHRYARIYKGKLGGNDVKPGHIGEAGDIYVNSYGNYQTVWMKVRDDDDDWIKIGTGYNS